MDNDERARYGIEGHVEAVAVPVFPGTPLRSLAAHAVAGYSDRLLAGFEGKARWKRSNALLRLYENLRRLDWRHAEYQGLSRAMCQAMLNLPTGTPTVPPMSELQLRLVDKAEAFHQHTYATTAVLCKCLNDLRDPSSPEYHRNKIERFLKQLRDRNERISKCYSTDIQLLLDSREFRSKHVDHPKSHAVYNWYTSAVPVENGRVEIVYFQREEPGDIPIYADTRSFEDPFSPDFRPPFDCRDFYVAPSVDKVYDAMQRVVLAAFNLDTLPPPGPPPDPAPPGALHLFLLIAA